MVRLLTKKKNASLTHLDNASISQCFPFSPWNSPPSPKLNDGRALHDRMRRPTQRNHRLRPKHRRLLRLHRLARNRIHLQHLLNQLECNPPRFPQQHLRKLHYSSLSLSITHLQRSDVGAQSVYIAKCEWDVWMWSCFERCAGMLCLPCQEWSGG